MEFKDNSYIIQDGLFWPEILRKDVPKSNTSLQPIFEAFTNSIEAIRDKHKIDSNFKGEIYIKINSTEATVKDTYNFSHLSIIDNGIGFNDVQFRRFNTFRDIRKNYKNMGSGRIQYVHYFETTNVKSVFEQDGKYYEREFSISKREDFLNQNAIVKHIHCKETEVEDSNTTLTFSTLAESSGVYNDLTEENLKEKLLERYIHYFCYNKNNLPEIKIQHLVQSKLKSETSISEIDIPNSDKTIKLKLQYSKKTKTGFEKTNTTEEFIIDAFKIPKNRLKDNKLNLVSKGEVIEESDVVLESLSKGDVINGNKYLFLVSSNYIDGKDSNIRGVLNIPSKDSFEKDLFANQEEILIEDIQDEVNSSIDKMYPEIEDVKQKHHEGFTRLKEMFLLDDKTAKDLNISINDSETKILEKFYEAEAKKAAAVDAKIKETFEKLTTLDTTTNEFSEDFQKEVEKLVKSIPLQNKNALTHYVARRKLILELFGKILGKKLKVQIEGDSGKGKEEALIHNLLFQQGSDNPEDSDLWILNEDFIYFKGSSEKTLSNIEIDGEKLFKKSFSEEEEKYLRSLGENRTIKRPDVLLFPEEGKCIILEFKAPEVNASDYLTQIDFYASLIRNYTEDKFQILTFYGYLIGESIESRDVLGRVSRYEHSYQFDYLFRPSEKVNGFDGRADGAIYTEVLKYSTLLERAIQRNKIFIEKLK